MHVASVGVSKLCFLSSLALCALLLILIPALQAPQRRQGDLPQPRPIAGGGGEEEEEEEEEGASSVLTIGGGGGI
ncbi:hypothetical protein CRUP_001633 [Coryphaenoides rupestris]|nr:hypothetical protein CRUP_001633 [Coryphaenoides rupestris]